VRSPGEGRARVVRGLALSTACLVVPVVAHVVAGGGAPTAGGFILGAALLSVACVALACRRVSVVQIAATVFASQPVLHVLLDLSAHADHGAGPSASAGMVAAHAIAAAALTVLLAGAESVIWSMATLSSTLLLRGVRAALDLTAVPVDLRPMLLPSSAAAHPFILSVTRTAPRRGPPVLLEA
jgi:hypothetical protein